MKNITAFALLIIFTSLTGWWYTGFFYPDPLEYGISDANFSNSPFAHKVALVAIPIFYILSLLILISVWRKILSLQLLILMVFGGVSACLVAYPFLSEIIYSRKLKKDLVRFHPFLQLTPPPIEYNKTKTHLKQVIFLGGSTTAWKNSNDETWPLLAARMSDPQFETINVSHEWYTSLHSVHQYITRLRESSAEVVVIMHAINDLLVNADFSQFSTGSFRSDYGHFVGPIRDLVQPRTITESIIQVHKRFWYHNPRTIIHTDSYPGLETFKMSLKTLIELAKSDGRRVLLLTQPNIYREDLDTHARKRLYMLNVEAAGDGKKWSFQTALAGMNIYNDTTKKIASEYQVEILDLDVLIPKTLEYFKDDVHYTDKAYPIIADAVANKVSQMLSTAK